METKKFFRMVAAGLFAAALCPVMNSCSSDDDDEIEDIVVVSDDHGDDLANFMAEFVRTDGDGNFLYYVKGSQLDDANPTARYFKADDLDEVDEIFRSFLPDDAETTTTGKGNIVFTPRDPEGKKQGVITLSTKATDDDRVVASVTFSKDIVHKDVSSIRFISGALWPENGESPYQKNELVTCKWPDYYGIFSGTKEFLCIQEYDADPKNRAGILIAASDKTFAGGLDLPVDYMSGTNVMNFVKQYLNENIDNSDEKQNLERVNFFKNEKIYGGVLLEKNRVAELVGFKVGVNDNWISFTPQDLLKIFMKDWRTCRYAIILTFNSQGVNAAFRVNQK